MTGVRITAEFQDAEVRRAIAAWARLGREATPILRAIGVGLVRNTQDRFDDGEAPDGTGWEPLSPAYAEMKTGPGILRESGMRGGLMGSITFDVGRGELAIGSNKVYAAVHQFGATIKPVRAQRLIFRTPAGVAWGSAESVTIPARPYLGISRRDEETILDVAEVFLRRAGG